MIGGPSGDYCPTLRSGSDAKPAQEGAEESDCHSENERSREGDHEQYDSEGDDGGGHSHRVSFEGEPVVSGAPGEPRRLRRSGLLLSDTSEATVQLSVRPGTSQRRRIFVERVHVLVSDSIGTAPPLAGVTVLSSKVSGLGTAVSLVLHAVRRPP